MLDSQLTRSLSSSSSQVICLLCGTEQEVCSNSDALPELFLLLEINARFSASSGEAEWPVNIKDASKHFS